MSDYNVKKFQKNICDIKVKLTDVNAIFGIYSDFLEINVLTTR